MSDNEGGRDAAYCHMAPVTSTFCQRPLKRRRLLLYEGRHHSITAIVRLPIVIVHSHTPIYGPVSDPIPTLWDFETPVEEKL